MTSEKAAEIVRQYKKIKDDYAYRDDILNDDDIRVARVKKIMAQELTEVERTILILYTEMQSFRKLGEVMGCSHQTMRNEVQRIKEKIWKVYGKGLN
jgi:DNA-directed RNA polymerase specialized sigma24 family protein